jgi:hypothetical protein
MSFPFKELVNPVTGVMDRIPWHRDRAIAKLQEIRRKHKERLNAEDCERARQAGIGHMIDEKLGVLGTIELKGAGAAADEEPIARAGNYVVDPLAARLKHDGRALKDAYIPEWQAFCSRPQNDDNVEYPTVTYVPKGKRVAAGPAVSPVLEAPVSPLKRRPGRPRKELLANV